MPTESNNGNKKSGGRGGGGKSRGKSGGKSRGEAPAEKKVASEVREEEEEEDLCQVCMNQMTVYSVGRCNHTICFICSTRMRVLCQKNECAICRQDMPMVIFTTAKLKFEDIKDNIYPMDRKYKICFETEEIQNSYTKLLSHESPVSPGVSFKTFQQLDKHLRREHELYYCELCVTNLHLFSHERKFYTRKELVEHRRKGDPGDTSFKGHPLCKFCDTRFFDDEELFKHLRTEHFFCFLCDADGIQYFYNDYSELRDHFYADHYLCTEPQCEKNKFVVFRTEIDLKRHRLELHQGDMSKAASRETRKVELEFSYNSGRRERERGGGGRERGQERREERRGDEYQDQLDGPVREREEAVPDLFTDFPSLSGRQVAAPTGGGAQSWSSRSGGGPSREEEYPSLPGAPAVPEPQAGGRTRTRPDRQPAGPPVKSRQEDFPSLPGAASVITPSRPTSAETFVKKKTNPSREPARPSQAERVDDFPSLPLASKPLVTSASARVVPTNKKPTVIKPSSTTIPVQNYKKSQKKAEKSKFSDEEDDYPSLSGPSIQLNNFSKKTVQSSGQDLAYSAAQISSNIKTIDKSFLESQSSSSNNATKTSGKVQVNSTMDFPDLGKPQQSLDLSLGKKNSGKKQNKKNNNNHNTASQKEPGKTSLNSICEFLHDGGLTTAKAPAPAQASAKKRQPEAAACVKPIQSKGTKEEVPRPSKMLGNNNHQQLQQPPVKAVSPPTQDTEDFPSLGKASKKIGRTFISAEEKKMMSAPSMWNKNQAGKENVSQASLAPSKPATKLPPGFVNRKRKAKYISPTDFQERNFALITTITDLLGGKSLEFKMFKEISGKFRTGQIGSAAYFSQCKELIEEKKISQIFPELLSLLPDIDKQQELYRLQELEPWSDGNTLSECPQCSQISLKRDADRHIEAHTVEDDFPEL